MTLIKFRQFVFFLKTCIYDISNNFKFIRNNSKFNDDCTHFANLRVKCHILDKGLNNQNFEQKHGRKIYEEAKRELKFLSNSVLCEDPSFKWCVQVISNYETAQKDTQFKPHKSLPVFFTSNDKDMFLSILSKRTSVRNFNFKRIDSNIWRELVNVAISAPTGCCRLSTRFHIIQNVLKIKELLPYIAGVTCFSSIQNLVIVTADTRNYTLIDRLLPALDAAFATQNFILAAYVNNIHSTILNAFHINRKTEKKIKVISNIPEYEQLICFIAMGYVDEIPIKPVRTNPELCYSFT